MAEHVPLSVLDLSPVTSGNTARDALHNTIDLAVRTEQLGYRRFWLAEHHLVAGVASTSPGVLIALVAGATSSIRVGSGAVLLGNCTPLEAAEQFGTIAHLHPGRVDLGLGRSVLARLDELAARTGGTSSGQNGSGQNGSEPSRSGEGAAVPPQDRVVDGVPIPAPPPRVTGGRRALERLREQARLLGVPRDSDAYREQVEEVLAWRSGEFRNEQGQAVRSATAEGADLDVWVLGSSAGPSARAAGQLGLPFVGNYHVSPSTVLETLAAYREAFIPSVTLAEPYVVVSADVVVAEDDETARELAAPYAEWVHSIRAGDGAAPFGTPEEVDQAQWTDDGRALVDDRVRTQITGSPATVVERLEALRRATGADELLITTITHDHADRVRSYELLARAWNEHRRTG